MTYVFIIFDKLGNYFENVIMTMYYRITKYQGAHKCNSHSFYTVYRRVWVFKIVNYKIYTYDQKYVI